MQISPSTGYVKDTGTPTGRGVFASRHIAQDELVETAPVVTVRCPYETLPPEIKKIVFHWGVLANMPGVHAIAFGFGSMYNHANPANMRYQAAGDGNFIQFFAVVDIEPDTELTINYNAEAGRPVSSEDNWFLKTGVQLHAPPVPDRDA